jgi:hypothetical protein
MNYSATHAGNSPNLLAQKRVFPDGYYKGSGKMNKDFYHNDLKVLAKEETKSLTGVIRSE